MLCAACAICKNEEKNIPQWLTNTANFDYRIVVDTGSTDNSVALLKEAGVSVARKTFEPFRFDGARNSVLEFVPPSVDWIAWPDFDEYYNKNWRYELERTVAAYPWITRLTYDTREIGGGDVRESPTSGTVAGGKMHKSGVYRWEKPEREYLVFTGAGDEAVKHVSGIARYRFRNQSAEGRTAGIAKKGRPEFTFSEEMYTFGKSTKDIAGVSSELSASARMKTRDKSTSWQGAVGASTVEDPMSGGLSNNLSQSPSGASSPSGTFPSSLMRKMIFDLFKNEAYSAGIELARVYLANEPQDIPVVNEYAGALYRSKRFEEAIAVTEELARRFPENAGVIFNLAKCYQALKRPDDAAKLLKLLLKKDPNNREYKLDYALYLSGEGKFDESERVLRSISPDDRVRFNLGWYEMRKGNFVEGFRLRDCGRSDQLWGSEHMTSLPREKRYRGQSLQGKTVLLFCEGGLGDEMIFARFAGIPRERGAKRVIMGCSPALVDIFSRSFKDSVDEILPMSEAKKRSYDHYVPMMNAPNLLNMKNLDTHFPYLSADSQRVSFWKEKMNRIAHGKLKIGIRWAGNPKFEHELFREIDPMIFMGLNKYGQLFSLQRDHGAEKLPHNYGVYDLQNDLTSWDETLAVLSNLDIFVSSCTSLVHAAGALGVRTCVIVPIAPYFTWAESGEGNVWYPSVTVLHQEKLRSWREPMDRAQQIIRNI